MSRHHPLDWGAELTAGGTRFRIWAPDASEVSLAVEEQVPLPMLRAAQGFFEIEAPCGAGTRYQYLVNDQRVPDPAARAQATDVHGPSLVVDPRTYEWQHPTWNGRPWCEIVIYELHLGCVGGFTKALELLPHLADLGITAIEFMPIADFSGARNWGYDGVLLYAPDRSYGSPEDLKRLIDAAHGLGLCVYLDVVYNHFGPDGNYLPAYAQQFFDSTRSSPWGGAIDFSRAQVQQFFIDNALYWITEYGFDGLRLDAVHAIANDAFLHAMARQIRERAPAEREIHLMLENENNQAALLDAGGYNAQWNDDAHNALHVILTGERESYYANFAAQPTAHLARCLAQGFAYQGETPPGGASPRGAPSAHLPPHAFIFFLQNHDQTGNRALGERLLNLADRSAVKAAIALQLLCPQIPLLFMGEELGLRTPFLYFTDFHAELAHAVREGRRREFAKFAAFADEEQRQRIPDPNAVSTFETCTINHAQACIKGDAQEWFTYYRNLLQIRRAVLTPHLREAESLGAQALADGALAARWRLSDRMALTLIANFSADELAAAPPNCGELIFESQPNCGALIAQGRIAARSCSAFIAGQA